MARKQEISSIAAFAPLAIAVAGVAFTRATFAAHPLQTEDTGTQGGGNVEWENGLARSAVAGERSVTFQPQLSWGVSPTLDLIAQPSWVSLSPADQPRVRGLGDTNLDFKWRFFGEAPWSIAVRAGATVATAAADLGLPHGTAAVHAVLVATYDAAPFGVLGNLGYARNPRQPGLRKEPGLASAAVTWAANESLALAIEAGADSNPDANRASWTRRFLAAAIYTVRPGLDLDIGLQLSGRSTPSSRTGLLGLTWRFAP